MQSFVGVILALFTGLFSLFGIHSATTSPQLPPPMQVQTAQTAQQTKIGQETATIDPIPSVVQPNTSVTIAGTASGPTGAVNIIFLGPDYTGNADVQTLEHMSMVNGGNVVQISNGRWVDGSPKVSRAGTYLIFVLDAVGKNILAKATFSVADSSQSSVSVSGMSEYTDSDFGFSFWYPSGWTVTQTSSANLPAWLSGVSPVDTLAVSNGSVSMQINAIVPLSKGVTMSGPKNDETFYFDSTKGEWTDSYDWDPNNGLGHYSEPVDVSNNTMGGLHIIAEDLVPLSASKFILVTPSQDITDGTMVATLINTIVATDPSAATPVSTAQQTATIQAEATAYAGQ